MASFLPAVDERGDAELISAVRAGDVGAYGELFSRHVAAARRLARQLVPAGDVDDLVSEAFAKVLVVLQRGDGPDLAFRAYLLTAVRRLHVDRIRANARLHSTDDLTPFDPGVPFRDTAVEGFESAAAARAFASLPERWQLVLWHTEVEGQKPADIAPMLAMSPNAVSALAYRAREGLRQAYLSMHAADVDDDACARTRGELGAYVRGGLSRRDAARVEQHLRECRRCTAIYLELTEVNSGLRALLAPLLLGTAAAGYVAATGTSVGTGAAGGIALLLGRARDAVVSHAPTAAVAGAAASAVVAGTVVSLHQRQPDATPGAEAPPASITPSGDAARDDDHARRPHVARHRAPDPRDSTNTAAAASRLPTLPAGPYAVPSPTADPQAPAPAVPQPAQAPPEGADGAGGGPSAPAPQTPPAPSVPDDPAPSAPAPESPAPESPAPEPLVDLSAAVTVGPAGLDVGLGLGVAGVPILPETHGGVPLPGSG